MVNGLFTSGLKAVLLSFKLNDNKPVESGDLAFYDKVDTKFAGWTEAQFKEAGVRVVPPAVARRGSFKQKCCVDAILCQHWCLC